MGIPKAGQAPRECLRLAPWTPPSDASFFPGHSFSLTPFPFPLPLMATNQPRGLPGLLLFGFGLLLLLIVLWKWMGR